MLGFLHRAVAAIFAVAFLALAASSPAQAQLEPPVVAVVDIQAILTQSEAAKAIQGQLDSARRTVQEEMQAREAELREGEQDLRRQRTVLAPDAFEERMREFQGRVAEVERQVQDRMRGLDQAFSAASDQIKSKILEVVANIAQEQGVDIVLSRQHVVLAQRALDLTEPVMERLNAQLPSVTVNLPAPN